MRRALLAAVLLSFLATPADATSTRVFAPATGQSIAVDALRLDVLDVKATGWTPPPGIAVLHYATVRATDGSEMRTLTISRNPDRVDVIKDHAIRLLEQPLRIAVEPAPHVAVSEAAAARVARARAASLGWAPRLVASVLVRGATWEISFHLAEDLDGVVTLDATSGRVLSATKTGGA